MEVQIYPVAVNKGERKFINDLKRYYEQHGEGREIYLLRNVSHKRVLAFLRMQVFTLTLSFGFVKVVNSMLTS